MSAPPERAETGQWQFVRRDSCSPIRWRALGLNGRVGSVGGVLEILLPRTDAGVAVQIAVVMLVGTVALRIAWRHAEWRIFVLGGWLLSLSLLGVRAVH